MEKLDQLQKLMQMGQQVQARMADAQKKLEDETVTASSGGGLVEVTASGKGAIRSIRIDPKAIDPSDPEMLEDLVLAALTKAQSEAREALEREMKQAAGGLPMPDLDSLLGG